MSARAFQIKQAAFNVFGNNAFEHGLFYVHDAALRFELSIGGSYIDMFHQAYSKTLEITDDVFSDSAEITACISFYGDAPLVSNLSIFRDLADFDIKLTKTSCEIWQTKSPVDKEFPDDEMFRTFIAFPVSPSQLKGLLWAAVASDFAITPKINASIYLFDIHKQILVHPYDDRGMDIIGKNMPLKQQLFDRYNHYLLDYDREEMEKHFT